MRIKKMKKTQPEEPQLRAKWTTSLTKILVDLMVDQVHRGNKQNSSFAKKAWKCICEEFYKKTGLKWDKEQLKNRYAVLRKQYVITKSLLGEPDFMWDEPTGAIVATDEAWNKYIQEHPDAETVRSSGCRIYRQLCIIFSEPGAYAKHNNGFSEYEEQTPGSIPCPQPLAVFHREVESSSESEEIDDIADEQDRYLSTTPRSVNGGRKRRKKGIDNMIANAILEMATASKMRADAITQHNGMFSITDTLRALDELEGVDDKVYFAALDLFNNRTAREIFLSLKVDKRLTWLQGKCAVLTGT